MKRGAIVTIAKDLIKRTGQTTTVESGVEVALDQIARRHDFKGMSYVPDAVDVTVRDLPQRSYGLLPGTYHHILHAALWNGSTLGTLTVKSRLWMEEVYPRGSWNGWYCFEGEEDLDDDDALEPALFIMPKPNEDHDLHVVVSRIPVGADWDADEECGIDGIDMAIVYGACEYVMGKLFGPLSDSAKGWMAKKEMEILKAIQGDQWDPALVVQACVRGRLGDGGVDPNRPNPTFDGVSEGVWSGVA